jgi:hypothetical protein
MAQHLIAPSYSVLLRGLTIGLSPYRTLLWRISTGPYTLQVGHPVQVVGPRYRALHPIGVYYGALVQDLTPYR